MGTGGHTLPHAARVWLTGLVLVGIALGTALWPGTQPAMATSVPFSGTPAVGALFSVTSGHRLGTHFCTASVVDSPGGDLLVTAAHCVQGYSDSAPAGLAFVPAYDNGSVPYGVWTVTRIFVDRAWASAADPDDDVAFLTVAQSGSGTTLQSITGGDSLGIGQPARGVMQVIGYPESADQPIVCRNRVTSFSASQLQFDCQGFTGGTSGSPFLTDVNPATGTGTVVGVIGGYQQGGDTPDVSYAAALRGNVASLYNQAVAAPVAAA
jgi:V8-like Glu-specific endopeptidase